MSYLACPKCGNDNFIGQYVADIIQQVQLTRDDKHTYWEWGEEEHREGQPDDEIKTVYCRPCDKDIPVEDLVAP